MWGTGMVAYGFVRGFCGVGISQASPGLRGMGGQFRSNWVTAR